MKKLLISLLILGILAGCNMPKGIQGNNLALSLPPQAWIDAPLDNMQLPLAPYEVVFHGSDPGSVVQGEFSVNGQVSANLSNPNAEEHLVVFRVNWTPPGPGQYTLRARALNGGGAWSEYSEVMVTVGGPTVTPTETTTVTPGTTVSPTVTPTLTSTPTAASLAGAGFSNKSISSNVVSRGHCGTSQVTMQIDAQHPAGIKVVVIFFRLEDFQTGQLSPWNDGISMNISRGHYVRTLSGDQFGALAKYEQARIHYQFIMQPMSGEYVRSEVYSDLTLTPCGGGGQDVVTVTPIPLDINPFP